jgi:hypothetical protein
MTEDLEKKLIDLEKVGDEIIKTGKTLLEKFGITEFTLFCAAILNRTINLNRGFVSLVRDNNYITAAPLVRINVDSLLRLFAATQSEYNYEQFAKLVREGTKIENLYDKKRKTKLKDSELSRRLSMIEGFSWIQEIYRIGSGFVHLSNQHIYSSFKIENNIISGGIRMTDEFIPESEKKAGTYYMIQTSKGIKIFIDDWIETTNKSTNA